MIRVLLIAITLGIGLSKEIKNFGGNETSINIMSKSESLISVEVNVGDVNFDVVTKDGNNFTSISLNSMYSTNEIGKPSLPQINELTSVPFGAEFEVHILNEDYIDFDLSKKGYPTTILPTQQPVSKSANPDETDFIIDNNTYTKDEFINNEIVAIKDKGVMRSIRVANIMTTPFNYNPVSGILRVYTKIQFEINIINADMELTNSMRREYFSPYFEPIFNSSIYGYEGLSSRDDDLIEEKVTYVIVANQTFRGYLDDFIDWKTQKGFNVIDVYTDEIGSSASAIRSYLVNLYNSPGIGNSPPSFVLLVGDTQQLPASYSSGGHVSDLDYCDFTNDNLPEILHGRFSASNPSQLIVQTEKTMEYEQYAMADPSFLQDVIMISGVDANYAPTYGNGQINYGNSYYFNFTNGISSNTFLYPASGSAGSQILNLADQGASFMNYTAHGYEQGWADPAFDNNDVSSMTNNGKYPTMVGNCCLTNAFDSGTCFGEALLRKSGGGAIGYIGGSDVTYWNEDYWWGVGSGGITSNPNYNSTGEGAYDGMFHEQDEETWAVVNAAIMYVGNLAVAEANGMDDYYWEIYHLMGDPSLSTYFGVPSTNDVQYDEFLPIGSEAIEVQAEPFSYIGITQDGNLIGSGSVDDSGFSVIVFNSPVSNPGIVDIVVTAQNRQPYFGEIVVASPDGAFVTVDNVDINYGADNTITPGETIDITVAIENLGNESSSNVEVSLFEMIDNPYISIVDGSDSINNLLDGSTAYLDLSFNVSGNAPFGHSFALQLELDSEENEWSTTLTMTVQAMVESFENASFTDAAWEFDGDADWTIDQLNYFDGMYSARSGELPNAESGQNVTSDLVLTMNVIEDGQISFYKKVSCEDVGSQSGTFYDYLAFYIDGVEQNKWAGEVAWSNSSFPVSAGEHTFTWRFNKDQGVVAGSDAVWIDNITFPPVESSGSMLGDLNGDGENNVLDVILMVNTILLDEGGSPASDMNGDGQTNVLDVVSLVNLILEG